MMEILIVSRHDMVRGPVMRQIMTTQAQERGLDIQVQSAGIEASSYVLSSSLLADTMKAMQSLRYNPQPHTPTQITEKMINGVDLVLCFNERYLEQIKRLANHSITDICLIHEFAGTDFEVANIDGMYRTNWILNKLSTACLDRLSIMLQPF